MLANYLSHAIVIEQLRKDPRGIASRALTWLVNRRSFCRWYRLSSVKMEIAAFGHLRNGFGGLIHVLWGDHDLGFLDLARKQRHKLVATFHNCDDTLPDNLRFPARVRALDGVILMSETQRRFFLSCGLPADRIHVIHHGVDTQYFQPHRRREPSTFSVLSVGTYRRDFALLRKVCEILAQANDICFRVVASPNVKPLFDGLSNVTFLSAISDEQLLAEYQRASCFIAMTQNATANNALVEAMACGLPVIAERVGGTEEYVTQGTGLLCDHGDAASLVAAIQQLSQTPALVVKMGAVARQRAKEFDWANVATKTEALYRRLLQEG